MRKVSISAAVYFALGVLGLQLAAPPGYATPLWPAAGWAVAAAIVWGRSGGIGVALGSALVNMLAPNHDGPLWIDAAIGLGAGAQAWVAAMLVKNFVNNNFHFTRPMSVVMFFLIAGPVACLVNSTFGPIWLWLNGALEASALSWNMALWWAGDWLGVMVAAPLFLSVIHPDPAWRYRRKLMIPIQSLTMVMHATLFLVVRDVVLGVYDPTGLWVWIIGTGLALSLAMLSLLLMLVSVQSSTGDYLTHT